MVNIYAIAFITIAHTVLLERRCGTGFGTGMYHLIGGKIKQGETARAAVQREVREKTGLVILQESFSLAHALHRKGTETEFIALFFAADASHLSEPHNTQPDSYDDMRFFSLNELPQNILPAHLQVIRCIQSGSNYSEHGW